MHENDQETPIAIVVGVALPGTSRDRVEEHLDELVQLADTAGFAVPARLTQDRDRPDSSTFIGTGKVEELRDLLAIHGANTALFDDELAPAHMKNLEKRLGVTVIDRTGLILAIFAQRARTREARTQVELARMQYQLPRLTRMWTHLSRQKGGIGMRGGEGESQLEVDRRMIKKKIADLQEELGKISTQLETRRRGREGFYRVAIVGYTNAGKSTLLNALTRAGVLAEDRLFATLDPTTQKLTLPDGGEVLLTDTVGFIRKLPHLLVASFRSTLAEACDADLLLHVVDASHTHFLDHIRATEEVLAEIGAGDKPHLLVLNKVDRLDGPVPATTLPSVGISAITGQGLDELLQAIVGYREAAHHVTQIVLPAADGANLALIHREAQVIETVMDGDEVHLKIKASKEVMGRLRHLLPT
ncbi:MAG: GTPase HflX [Candidatus Sericytochromatia bacterium]|nr:GTPase HflX [Candidatus Sericytochromatia bacterium]